MYPIPATTTYGTFAIYLAEIVVVLAAIIAISYVLGGRHHDKRTDVPFESGILPLGEAHVRLSATFYLVAMFFVIFYLEAVYVFAWSVAAARVGWPGYIEMLIFLGVLVAALIYLWRVGAHASYFVMTLGAFAVISICSQAGTTEGAPESDRFADYRGLFWRQPWLATAFTLSLLALAGIPLTMGFIAKFFAIAAGVGGAQWTLVMT